MKGRLNGFHFILPPSAFILFHEGERAAVCAEGLLCLDRAARASGEEPSSVTKESPTASVAALAPDGGDRFSYKLTRDGRREGIKKFWERGNKKGAGTEKGGAAFSDRTARLAGRPF